MTHLLHVGEPASTRADGPLAVRTGEARASVGPGGIQVVVAVAEPSDDEREAVETGRVSLGVADEPGPRGAGDPTGRGRSALLVQIGEAGAPGYVEASAEVDAGVWWGGDVELALCDGRGVVRAVRRFRGPMADPVGATSGG